MVFQYQKGKQTMRERPSSYRDKKTVVQLAQREKMKKAQQLYRIVKDVVKGCFEFKKPNQRDCDSFMSANILDFGTMAQGTLSTLSCRFEEGHAVCDIIPDDWKEGDVLRFVSVEGEKVNSIDKIVALTLLVNVEMIEENLVSTAVFIYNATVFSPVFYSKKASQLHSKSAVPPLFLRCSSVPKSVVLRTKVGVSPLKCPK